ncbi:MAG: response regulator [Erysipelotrichia bacterium]|nr:response regulator [Erysipelotrichia bacterium]
MVINIGICDDESHYLEKMEKLIADYFKRSDNQCFITKYKDGEELLNKRAKLDILFLDIEMKKMSGIEIKNKLEMYCDNCKIIFVSNYDNRMKEAFGKNVIAFISKSKIDAIIYYLACIERELKEHKIIKFGNYQVDIFDVIYIKAEGSYVNIITKFEKYICCIYLSDVLAKLPISSFLKGIDHILSICVI